MQINLKSDVVILGAGIIGMVTAIALSNRGIKTTIIERRIRDELLSSKDERNIAITKTTEKWLKLNNIWDDLAEFVAKVNDIYVIDDKDESSMIHLYQKNKLSQELGHMILHNDLIGVIFKKIEVDVNITLMLNSNYADINAQDTHNFIYLDKIYILIL